MPRYSVDMPIAGHVTVEVEADNEKEAIEKALETEWTDDDIQELESYSKLVEGNVCYPYHTRASATLIEDEESEASHE